MSRVWVVEQNGVVVCATGMGLTRKQAENKVENEMRMNPTSSWKARPAMRRELNPPRWVEEICED